MSRAWIGWLAIVLVVLGTSCSDRNSVPSGILSREDMQNVLWDMIQADQFSTYLVKDSARVNLKMENLRLYDQVFQMHHISREAFSKSYQYYMARPDLTQTLFDSLQAMGNRLRSETYSHPVIRNPTPAPPATPPPATSKPAADSAHKKPFGVPSTPVHPPLHHPLSSPKPKTPAP